MKAHGLRRLLGDLSSVAGLTAIVKLAGAAKIVVSARYFGTGDALDAYLLAFLIPSFLSDLLAGSLTPALLPTLIAMKGKGTARIMLDSYADVLYKSTLVLSAIALLVGLISGPLLKVLGSTFSPGKLETTRALLLIMLPILPLAAVSASWRGVLYSECRFRIASIAPVATPLVTVAFLYGYSGAHVRLLAIATTLGYLAELSVLAVALRRFTMPLFPRWGGTVSTTAQIRKQYIAVVGGTLVMSVSSLVNQTLAAQSGSGGVSTYNLGTRLVTVFLVVGPAALGTVILPRFSRSAADEDWITLRRLAKHYLLAGMAAAVPVITLIFFCSPFLVRVLFQSKALSPSAASQISSIQSLSFLQLPFAVGLTILFGVLASIRSNQILFRVSVASLIPTIVMSWLLARTHGILGITVAPACAQALVFVLLACIWFKRIQKLERVVNSPAHTLSGDCRDSSEGCLVPVVMTAREDQLL